MACCRGGSRTAPTKGAAGCARCSLARRTRLHERHVGATRCVALVPSCTPAPHHRTRPPVYTAPHGRPTGSPLHCLPEGFGRSSERTESCRLFLTEQQRDASPCQGEAGAQRRVRVHAVVVRPHHPNVPARHGPHGGPTGSPPHCVPVGSVSCAGRGVRRGRPCVPRDSSREMAPFGRQNLSLASWRSHWQRRGRGKRNTSRLAWLARKPLHKVFLRGTSFAQHAAQLCG
jgi:hypothetical protein